MIKRSTLLSLFVCSIFVLSAKQVKFNFKPGNVPVIFMYDNVKYVTDTTSIFNNDRMWKLDKDKLRTLIYNQLHSNPNAPVIFKGQTIAFTDDSNIKKGDLYLPNIVNCLYKAKTIQIVTADGQIVPSAQVKKRIDRCGNSPSSAICTIYYDHFDSISKKLVFTYYIIKRTTTPKFK